VKSQFGLEAVGVVMMESFGDRLPGGLQLDSLGTSKLLKKIDPTIQGATSGKVGDGLQPIAEEERARLVGPRNEAVRSARDLGSCGTVDRELMRLKTCPQQGAWLVSKSSMDVKTPSPVCDLPEGSGMVDDGRQIAIFNPNPFHRLPMPLVGAGIDDADRHGRMQKTGLSQEIADDEIGESQRDRVGWELSMMPQPSQQRGCRTWLQFSPQLIPDLLRPSPSQFLQPASR